MIEKISAIVLQTRKFGDSSKIAVLFSKEHGKISVLAKGAFNPKSKFAGSLQVSNQIDAQVYIKTNKELHTLSACEISQNRFNVQKDNTKLGLFLVSSEFISRTLREGEINTRLFKNFEYLLDSLNKNSDIYYQSLKFIFDLIDEIGFAFPKQKISPSHRYFSYSKGAFFDRGEKENYFDEEVAVKFMNMICKNKVEINATDYLKITNALIIYLSRHLDINLKINSLYLVE